MPKLPKRLIDIAVISDAHLGSYGAKAAELSAYLGSISPDILIMNGDMIDAWQFRKKYFPASHAQAIKEVLAMMAQGTKVFYITGNHDEMMRAYSYLHIGNLVITDKILIQADDKKVWAFHGDAYDTSTSHLPQSVNRLGSKLYHLLIKINDGINFMASIFGAKKMRLSKKLAALSDRAFARGDGFETMAAYMAIKKGYDIVICGHSHKPEIREVSNAFGSTVYMNSGDWVEHCTALEYLAGEWKIYGHAQRGDENIGTNGNEPSKSNGNEQPKLNVLSDNIDLTIRTFLKTDNIER